ADFGQSQAAEFEWAQLIRALEPFHDDWVHGCHTGRLFSLEIETTGDTRDLIVAELWELESAGIVELDDGRVRAFFEEDADRDLLRARYPAAVWRQEEPRDWVEAAREKLAPMLVGSHFFLVPEWRDDPTPPGRFRIVVNPGMAFGTGFHETT